MHENLKWINDEQLKIIDEKNNPKYFTIDDYVEENFDSLINHKVENIDEAELAEHILDAYQYANEIKLKNHIEKLYDVIFRFVYLPDTQNYWMKVEISDNISAIEKYLMNKDAINFAKEKSLKEINKQKDLYKLFYGITKDFEVPTVDILINNYHEEIIKKYAITEEFIY